MQMQGNNKGLTPQAVHGSIPPNSNHAASFGKSAQEGLASCGHKRTTANSQPPSV